MVSTGVVHGIRENTRAAVKQRLAAHRSAQATTAPQRLLCQTYKALATVKATAQAAA
jgi:hypothetical protein